MSDQDQQRPQSDAATLGMLDTWTTFAKVEIPAEIARLSKKPMTLDQLQQELHSTVMHCVHQTAEMLVAMRNDVYERLTEHEVGLETLSDRIDDVGVEEDETRLIPDDAEAIEKIAAAAKLLAEEALKTTTDQAAVAKLHEIVAIADYCTELAREKVVSVDEEEDEDETAVQAQQVPDKPLE